jgi:hypothetical protein
MLLEPSVLSQCSLLGEWWAESGGQSSLMMETVTLSEMWDTNSIFTWLIAQEDF